VTTAEFNCRLMLFFMNQSKIAKSEIDVVDIHVVELLTISSMIMRA